MKISEEVLQVLEDSTTEGNDLLLPPGQLERKLYLKVNQVLEAAGGEWTRKRKAHVFREDAAERLDQILTTGTVEVPADLGFFVTPMPVATDVIRLAEIDKDMTVLEPSAGTGVLAIMAKAKGGVVTCCEIERSRVEALRGLGFDTDCADFLDWHRNRPFDRVIMNPPFARQQDVLHVQKALTLLKPKGILVAVMSAGAKFRQHNPTKAFRDSLQGMRSVVWKDNDEGAFKASGTMVRTVIVRIQK